MNLLNRQQDEIRSKWRVQSSRPTVADGSVDSSGSGGVEVICAGLPRTGTSSMVEGLHELGYGPVYHMAQHFSDGWRSEVLERAFDRDLSDMDYLNVPRSRTRIAIRSFFAGFRATTDTPTCDMLVQLMRAFPDAKVVLTSRKTNEAWWKSFEDTVEVICRPSGWWGNVHYWCVWLNPTLRKQSALSQAIARYWRRRWGEYGPGAHDKHNAWVRSVVPKEKLLEFDLAGGYPVLCDFLGKPVPKDENGNVKSFPHVNDTKSLQRIILLLQVAGLVQWALLFGGVFSAVIYRRWIVGQLMKLGRRLRETVR
ncbi:hypothetical protein PYCC9005_004080 [Savitreella phatthalungensis]